MFAHLWNKVRQFQLSFSLDQIFLKKIHKAIFILLFFNMAEKDWQGTQDRKWVEWKDQIYDSLEFLLSIHLFILGHVKL